MKKAILLGLVILGLSVSVKAQEVTFKVKNLDVNYIGQSFDGIKQLLANSDLPSKQSTMISMTLDSITRILRKGIYYPPVPKVDTVKKALPKKK